MPSKQKYLSSYYKPTLYDQQQIEVWYSINYLCMLILISIKSIFLYQIFFSSKPSNQNDAELLRAYLTQVRQEVGMRVCDKVFGEDGKPSKWWLCFAKKKFMDKSLSGPGQQCLVTLIIMILCYTLKLYVKYINNVILSYKWINGMMNTMLYSGWGV